MGEKIEDNDRWFVLTRFGGSSWESVYLFTLNIRAIIEEQSNHMVEMVTTFQTMAECVLFVAVTFYEWIPPMLMLYMSGAFAFIMKIVLRKQFSFLCRLSGWLLTTRRLVLLVE